MSARRATLPGELRPGSQPQAQAACRDQSVF